MNMLKIYIHDLKQIETMIPSPKGGWVIKNPFMLIDKNFIPKKEVTFYEGAIVRTIIDKKGQEVPILKVWPHTCDIKCGERCQICGLKNEHQFEFKTKYSTEEECEARIYVCKNCGLEKREKGISHSFVMKEWGKLICNQCNLTKSIVVTNEIIKKYAVPPFPIEKALEPWNLSLKEIEQLHKECLKYHPLRGQKQSCYSVSIPKRDPKHERSYNFWLDPDNSLTLTYEDFLKFIKAAIEMEISWYVRFKYKDIYYILPKHAFVYFDLGECKFYIVKDQEKGSNPNILAAPIVEPVKNKNLSPKRLTELQEKAQIYRDHLFDKYTPQAEYIWEVKNLDELLQTLDIYDLETTIKLEEEYQKQLKEAEEKAEAFRKIQEEEKRKIEEKFKTNPTFQKLLHFLSESAYGRTIRYAVDPYNGFFGGWDTIRYWEITEIFYEGVKKLEIKIKL